MNYFQEEPIHLTKVVDGKTVLKCGTWKRFPRVTTNPAEATCKKCTGNVTRRSTPEITEDLVGKLIHSSWGYDMTHNEFYQIIKQTGKTVTAREVAHDVIDGGGYSGQEKPIKDSFISEPIVFKVNHWGNFVNNKVYGHSFGFEEWGRTFYYNTLD